MYDERPATSAGSDDPFGGLGDPMADIQETEGNLFSGFGGARPASTTAAPARTRRALPAAGRRAGIGAGAGTGAMDMTSAPAQRAATAQPAMQRAATVPASALAPSNTTAAVAPTASAASSGPPGPCPQPTLQLWYQWLGLDPRRAGDEKLLPIAQAAFGTKVPPNWSLQNGYWVNSQQPSHQQRHTRHPFLKHFLARLDSRRLALQFNVEDDSEFDESIIASGDETRPASPAGLDDSTMHNPLLSPTPKKKEQDIQLAHQPSQPTIAQPNFAREHVTAAAPSHLTVNTAASPSTASSSSFAAVPNMTPSPPSSSWQPPPSSAASTSRLESVPERRPYGHPHGHSESTSSAVDFGLPTQPHHGHSHSLTHPVSSAHARQLEEDRLLHERLSAASLQAAASSSMAQAGGSDKSMAELQAQLRLQSITIEELEKRKRSLLFELEQADVHLTALLADQRQRHETQLIESERRTRAEIETKRIEMQRMETNYKERIIELEDRLKQSELKRSTAIAVATAEIEAKSRDSLDHALKLAAAQTEAQRLHFERELESQRALHANEIASLKQQQHDSVFLRSLVSQVESSTSHLENLSKKVYSERQTSEKLTFEQLQIRDRLLKEKEALLDHDRQQSAELVKTFQRLQRENEDEKVRLREEHQRLLTMQQDIRSESALLHDQLIQERDHLRKERSAFVQQRDAWEQRQKREAQEIEVRKEMNERTHRQQIQTHAHSRHATSPSIIAMRTF